MRGCKCLPSDFCPNAKFFHCRPGATHRQAAFAFQLAREVTGKTVASYRAGEGSREGLMLDAVFAAAFIAAKERIRAMEYRYVEEADRIARRS